MRKLTTAALYTSKRFSAKNKSLRRDLTNCAPLFRPFMTIAASFHFIPSSIDSDDTEAVPFIDSDVSQQSSSSQRNSNRRSLCKSPLLSYRTAQEHRSSLKGALDTFSSQERKGGLEKEGGGVTIPCAVAFDIDGVLSEASHPLPGAREALQLLNKKEIPYMFLTNGGGVTEGKRLEILDKVLGGGLGLTADQMQLSHTPFKALVEKFKNKRILVVGCHEYESVAKEYGFTQTVTPQQLHEEYPHLFVQIKVTPKTAGKVPEAILIFTDPADWYREIQIISDVLSHNVIKNEGGTGVKVPIYFANPDFIYAARHHIPRFAGGSFNLALEALYRKFYGNFDVDAHYLGKPHPIAYDYAIKNLQARARKVKNLGSNTQITFNNIYAIGDNPQSDIKGANNAGGPWTSVLVKTGVFKGGKGVDNDAENPAKFVCENVLDAVKMIVEDNDKQQTFKGVPEVAENWKFGVEGERQEAVTAY